MHVLGAAAARAGWSAVARGDGEPGGARLDVDAGQDVEVGGASAPPVVDGRSDLRDGVVPGGGLVVSLSVGAPAAPPQPEQSGWGAPSPAPPAPPAPPPAPPTPPGPPEPTAAAEPAEETSSSAVVVSLAPEDPLPDEVAAVDGPVAASGPLPVAARPAADRQQTDLEEQVEVADEDAEAVMVDGISCVRGHFNRPDALYCSRCGISTAQGTLVRRRGPRPPLGVMVVDDGSTFSVDAEYLVGRAPESDERVRGGDLRALVVHDPGGSVSRAHAELRLDGWEVDVVDAGSANGTFVAAPDGPWEPVQPGQRRRLRPADRVLLGQRVLQFESHHVRR